MHLSYSKIQEIKAKYYDPNNISSRDRYRPPETLVTISIGIVKENQDPDGLGRVKVYLPLVGGKDTITPWILQIKPLASPGAGIWTMPEIDDQVLVGFYMNDANRPFVIGSMYTPRHAPPVEQKEGNHIKGFYTRSGHRVEFCDEDGKERLLISTKDGEMRLELDREKGLSIVNELGDINIKCRKLIMESEDACLIKTEKEFKITTAEGMSIESSSGMDFIASGDAILSGSEIDLKGSSGVTAEMMQIACEGDNVVGVDFHDIKVPTQSGLTTVPMIPPRMHGRVVSEAHDQAPLPGETKR